MTLLPNPDYFNHPKFQPFTAQVDDAARIAAMDAFLPAFHRSYADWIANQRTDFDIRIGPGDAALAELQAKGFALLKITPALKAELANLAEPFVAALDERLASVGKPKFRDMNTAIDRAGNERLYEVVDTAFRELHVQEIASAYVRRPMRIKKLFVQLNNATETRIRYGEIDAEGLPALKSNYWHIDSDVWPNVKVLIYLNDVGLDQGPLRYVVGSHRQTPSFETVVRKTNDTLKLPTAQFLALPDELRMHALFGPFLTGEEPESLRLLAREQAVCGGGADLIVFDNNGVHRGGFVRSGSRCIVQCLFEAA